MAAPVKPTSLAGRPGTRPSSSTAAQAAPGTGKAALLHAIFLARQGPGGPPAAAEPTRVADRLGFTARPGWPPTPAPAPARGSPPPSHSPRREGGPPDVPHHTPRLSRPPATGDTSPGDAAGDAADRHAPSGRASATALLALGRVAQGQRHPSPWRGRPTSSPASHPRSPLTARMPKDCGVSSGPRLELTALIEGPPVLLSPRASPAEETGDIGGSGTRWSGADASGPPAHSVTDTALALGPELHGVGNCEEGDDSPPALAVPQLSMFLTEARPPTATRSSGASPPQAGAAGAAAASLVAAAVAAAAARCAAEGGGGEPTDNHIAAWGVHVPTSSATSNHLGTDRSLPPSPRLQSPAWHPVLRGRSPRRVSRSPSPHRAVPLPRQRPPSPEPSPSHPGARHHRRSSAAGPSASGRRSPARAEAAADADLLLPWREGMALGKCTSYFMQLQLQFEMVEEPLEELPGGEVHCLVDSVPWGLAFDVDDGEEGSRRQAVLGQELRRQREIQHRIERREHRRAAAQHRARIARRKGVAGLRTAMWLIVCSLTSRQLWLAPAQRRLRDVLRQSLLPRWRFRMHRRRLQATRARLLAQTVTHAPSLETLQQTGPLFSGWPLELLTAFIERLRPAVFEAGEYMCHQGDPSDVLYILTAGEVDVVIRRPNSLSKARGKSSGLTVASFTPVRYVGEYGVFAGEPRSASLYCRLRTTAWTCGQDCLVAHLKQLPTAVYREINASFEASMAKIYHVPARQLATLPLFRGAPLEAVAELVSKFEPMCIPADTTIVEEGTLGTYAYFISKGRCLVAGAHTVSHVLSAGDMFGCRAAVFPERHRHSVRALNTVQSWRLPKAALMDFMLTRPDHFLRVRNTLNCIAADHLPKPVVDLLVECSSGALPRAVLEAVPSAALQPVVVEAGGPVVAAGAPVRELWFVVSGAVGDGAAGPRVLGLAEASTGELRWPTTLVAQERVEAWRVSFQDLLGGLGGGATRPGSLRRLLERHRRRAAADAPHTTG